MFSLLLVLVQSATGQRECPAKKMHSRSFAVKFDSLPLGIRFREWKANGALVVKSVDAEREGGAIAVNDTVVAVSAQYVQFWSGRRIAKHIKQSTFPLEIRFSRLPLTSDAPAALKVATTTKQDVKHLTFRRVTSQNQKSGRLSTCGGMGDQFTGVVTAFMVAVLANRSFSIDWPEAHQVFLNTNKVFTHSTRKTKLGSAQKVSKQQKSQVLNMCGLEFSGINPSNSALIDFYEHHKGAAHAVRLAQSASWQWLGWPTLPLEEIFPNDRRVVYEGNRGMTYAAFDNSLYAKRLRRELHLEKHTAYGYLFRYLFVPKRSIFDSFSMEFLSAIADPTIVKIGLHIRAVFDYRDEDFAANEEEGALQQYQPFFDCAQAIESKALRRNQHGTSVKWVLFSDSKTLRTAAKRKYGAKMLSAEVAVMNSHATEDGKMPPLTVAAAEHHLLAQCDWTVTTDKSAFSKTAAYASRSHDTAGTAADQHYTISYDPAASSAIPECQPVDFQAYAMSLAHI